MLCLFLVTSPIILLFWLAGPMSDAERRVGATVGFGGPSSQNLGQLVLLRGWAKVAAWDSGLVPHFWLCCSIMPTGKVLTMQRHNLALSHCARLLLVGGSALKFFSSFPALSFLGTGLLLIPFAFFKGRVLRLYPAVWICATLTLGVVLASEGVPFMILISSLSEINVTFAEGWGAMDDPVYWTLSVEISFYF